MVRQRLVLLVAALAGAISLLATVTLADAATLGPLASGPLNAFTGAGPSGAKIVLASDNFTGTSGTSLNGRAPVRGGTWRTPAGTWTIDAANQVEINGVPQGRATTAAGQANARVICTIMDSGAGGRTSGLVFRANSTDTNYLSVYTANGSGGRITLAKRVGSISTTLASFTGVPFTNPATQMVEVDGPTVRVYYNGTLYITHTLSAADMLLFGGETRYGMLNDNAATVRYDDFRVESL